MPDRPIPVRLSHLLRHCAVGAVVRGPDYLLTVQDTNTWNCGADHEIKYVDQVRAALGIRETLRSPPTARVESGEATGWSIPATRFPGWMRCSRCGLLHNQPWKRASRPDTRSRRHGDTWICTARDDRPSCGGSLEQAPWVLVHDCGYLAAVPWHRLAHDDGRHPIRRECRADRRQPYLKVVSIGRGHAVRCTRCCASGPLPERFPFGRTWQQPWFPVPPPQRLDEPAWVLAINDVRVHTPETVNALVIPPESRIRRGTVVDHLYGSTEKQKAIRGARPGLHRKTVLRQVAREFGCPPEEVERAQAEIDRGYPFLGQALPGGDLLQSEYRALVETIPDLREDEDFVTVHHNEAWSALVRGLEGAPGRIAAAVDRLVAVERLKEIMVFKGFRRLSGETVTPPDLTGASNWLPALELYGEGVFFTLDEARLRRWEEEDALQARARTFFDRFVGGPVRLDRKSTRLNSSHG